MQKHYIRDIKQNLKFMKLQKVRKSQNFKIQKIIKHWEIYEYFRAFYDRYMAFGVKIKYVGVYKSNKNLY